MYEQYVKGVINILCIFLYLFSSSFFSSFFSSSFFSSFFSSLAGPTDIRSTFPTFFSFFTTATVSISPITVNCCSFVSAAIESTPVHQGTNNLTNESLVVLFHYYVSKAKKKRFYIYDMSKKHGLRNYEQAF